MSISGFLVSRAASFKQARTEPVKPCNITESDLLPYKAASNAPVWKWFRLAKYVDYDKNKQSHSEFQRAYCMKCLLDGISTSISFLPTSPRKLQEQYILILLQPCMLLELQSAAISKNPGIVGRQPRLHH